MRNKSVCFRWWTAGKNRPVCDLFATWRILLEWPCSPATALRRDVIATHLQSQGDAVQSICRSTISSFLLCAAASTAIAAPAVQPRLSEAETISVLKAELEKRTVEDQFSGAVLVARAGKPVFEAAYGYADRDRKIASTTGTNFRFGSMGKMFTAVAIMQLVQAGKISVEDPLAKFLPDYPNREVASVTIYQLLTHTGGTGDIFGPEFDAHRTELKELADYVVLYGKRGLQFQPGTRHEYSNYGFVLLGRIIERASGQSYYDYVLDHIFKPAGMSSTGNLPESQHVQNLAVGYTRGGPLGPRLGPGPGADPGQRLPAPVDGPLRPANDHLPYRGTSAGGGYSTVGDLLRFANALTTESLLSAQLTALVTTGKVQAPRPGLKYAYGFEDETPPDGARRFGHGGGAPGMNGVLSIFPSSQYVVIVLANLDPPAAQEIARFISERLPM